MTCTASNFDWTAQAPKMFVQMPVKKLRLKRQALIHTRSNTPDENENSSKGSFDTSNDNSPYIESPALSDNSDFSPLKEISNRNNFEIDVCPKKKKFNNPEEHRIFVEDYKKKYKTELCKNWEIRRTCKFGDKCCFAHGKHELKTKNISHMKYKTKPCKQYHQYGYCPYGQRCQYLHKEAIQPNIFCTPCQSQNLGGSYSYETLHEINLICENDGSLDVIFSKLPNRPRLGVFKAHSESEIKTEY